MKALKKQKSKIDILVLNLPGLVLKSGSRWYNRTNRETNSLRYYPYPWFMGYLVSLLKSKGFSIFLADAVAMGWTNKQTIAFVKKMRPKYIVCEPTWNSVEEDADLLDSFDKNIIKIAVGNYSTNFPFECLNKTRVDYAVVGEYEFSVLKYFQNIHGPLPENFVSKRKIKYQYPKLIMDLDEFPFPERDDTPNNYFNEPSCFGKNIIMVSSRGCRLNCSFCNVGSLYGKRCYRKRSAKNVVDEIEVLLHKYQFDEIYFDDDNMVSEKKHIEEICREIIKRKISVRWVCMGDGLVENSTLKLLKQSGCTTYKFGVEHLDREVLANIPKPIKKDRILKIIKKCKRLKLKSYVNLMVGLPKSTFLKDIKMIKEIIKINPDFIQFSIATAYPGTEFYRKAKENNWLVSRNYSIYDATGNPSVSYPDYHSDKIKEAFLLGKKLWYRNLIIRKQTTLIFFIRSEIRRNGLFPTLGKSIFYIKKTFE